MFRALELSIQLARDLRDPLKAIRRADGNLADQIQRAATSVALNLAEGDGRTGKDQMRFYRQARGSAFEVRVGIRLVEAFGLLPTRTLAPVLDRAEHVCAILNRMLR